MATTPPAPPQQRPETSFDSVNAERKHLEGLLKDRINFHLIFASVFMAGLAKVDDPVMKKWAFLVITAISILISLAVIRTCVLAHQALKEIREQYF